MKTIIIIVILLSVVPIPLISQNYKYSDYLNDKDVEKKLKRNIQNNNYDSLSINFKQYKNNLGFFIYEVKALLDTNKRNKVKFLDSAFMKGLTPLCLPSNFKEIDSLTINKSFKTNYLKSYNIKLINIIDSIHYRDQYYRQLIAKENKNKLSESKKNTNLNENINTFQPNIKSKIKKLEQLQQKTDSSNFIKLNEIITEFGWPSASKVGVYYCQRPAADVTTILSNIDQSKLNFLIDNMYKIIKLCENQEESWQVPEWLIHKINSTFRDTFHEFYFIKIENGNLNVADSYFSIYNMTLDLMCHPKVKLTIKCRSYDLFEKIKNEMTLISNNHTFDARYIKDLKSVNMSIPEKIDINSIEFSESGDIDLNKVYYKFSLK